MRPDRPIVRTGTAGGAGEAGPRLWEPAGTGSAREFDGHFAVARPEAQFNRNCWTRRGTCINNHMSDRPGGRRGAYRNAPSARQLQGGCDPCRIGRSADVVPRVCFIEGADTTRQFFRRIGW